MPRHRQHTHPLLLTTHWDTLGVGGLGPRSHLDLVSVQPTDRAAVNFTVSTQGAFGHPLRN
jgi:hypothetical protein